MQGSEAMILNGRHQAQVAHARAAHGQLITGHSSKVWIDYTGTGRVVFDIFKQERMPHIMPLTIAFGGQEGPNDRGGHNVPKLSLVGRLHRHSCMPGACSCPSRCHWRRRSGASRWIFT
ncbi:hypothetical protein B0E52_14980 [Rhodanobacter sp. C06]|nr:hypothetical protein B0E52_14980 [Rhodanobacter sp. C06]